jgi:hypothetical protein
MAPAVAAEHPGGVAVHWAATFLRLTLAEYDPAKRVRHGSALPAKVLV